MQTTMLVLEFGETQSILQAERNLDGEGSGLVQITNRKRRKRRHIKNMRKQVNMSSIRRQRLKESLFLFFFLFVPGQCQFFEWIFLRTLAVREAL